MLGPTHHNVRAAGGGHPGPATGPRSRPLTDRQRPRSSPISACRGGRHPGPHPRLVDPPSRPQVVRQPVGRQRGHRGHAQRLGRRALDAPARSIPLDRPRRLQPHPVRPRLDRPGTERALEMVARHHGRPGVQRSATPTPASGAHASARRSNDAASAPWRGPGPERNHHVAPVCAPVRGSARSPRRSGARRPPRPERPDPTTPGQLPHVDRPARRLGPPPPPRRQRRQRACPPPSPAWSPPRPTCRPAAERAPCSNACRRMSAERDENSPSSCGAIPSISTRPRDSDQRTPNSAAQAGPQVRLVHGPARSTMRPQPPVITRPPAPVGPVDQVGHHDVAVQVRIEVAIDPVREHGGQRARRGDHRLLGSRPPHRAHAMPFQVGHGSGHRLGVHPDDPAGYIVTAQERRARWRTWAR